MLSLRPFWRPLAAALLALPLMAGAAQACSLTVGYEPWEPYQFKNAKGEVVGIDIELVTVYAKDAGCAVTFMELPWARQLKDIEDGRLSIAMAASRTPEREAFGLFSAPYRDEEFRLFVRTGEGANASGASVKDVIGKMAKVAITRGYYAGDEVEALMGDASFKERFHEVANEDTSFKMLLAGRVDAVLTDRFVGFAGARLAGGGDRVQLHPLSVRKSPVHLLFSRKGVTPDVVQRIDAAIVKAKADGRAAAILAKY